jgi:hypothetical protein
MKNLMNQAQISFIKLTSILILISTMMYCNKQKNEVEPINNIDPLVGLSTVTEIAPITAKINSKLEKLGSDQIVECGHCWAEGDIQPTIINQKTEKGPMLQANEINSTLIGLKESTEYTVRAYLKTSSKIYYGSKINFKTLAKDATPVVITPPVVETPPVGVTPPIVETPPVVATPPIVVTPVVETPPVEVTPPANNVPPSVETVSFGNISSNSVLANGKVTSDGNNPVTDYGFVWVLGNGDPSTNNNKIQATNKNGTGNYSGTISGLSPAITYSIKAYATSASGVGYGVKNTFTTNAAVATVCNANPSVKIDNATNITAISAKINGRIVSEGGPNCNVIQYGHVWGKIGDADPTVASNLGKNVETNPISSGNTFSSSITGLVSGNKYKVRSFARNGLGSYAYSDIETFTTLCNIAAPTITQSDANICHGEYVTYTAIGCPNGNISWSTGLTGPSIRMTPGGTVTVTATCKIDICTSTVSNMVTTTVKRHAEATTGSSSKTGVLLIDHTFNGTIIYGSDNNVTDHGFVWVAGNGTPDINSNRISLGAKSGATSIKYVLKNQANGLKFSYRAYVKSCNGTVKYGEVKRTN